MHRVVAAVGARIAGRAIYWLNRLHCGAVARLGGVADFWIKAAVRHSCTPAGRFYTSTRVQYGVLSGREC